MPITTEYDEKTNRLITTIEGRFKGLDSESPPMAVLPDHFPDLQNVNLSGGTPVRIDGHILHATSMTLPAGTEPTLFARRVPSSGTAEYVAAGRDGNVYFWTGSAWTSLRQGLSTASSIWWSHTQLGDYLAIANPIDGNYKYDGTRLLPLGAKYIADMETGEATWAGGSTSTTVREGTQSRSLTGTAGGTDSMTLTPATAWDLIDGLLSAKDYNTTTDRISFYVNLNTAANLDTALSYIRFGNAADTAYFQALASTWGTLANGWNLVRVARSSFTTTGAPNWNSIAKLTFFIDANPATSVTAIFDDVYVIYEAVSVMPAVQVISNWKNMITGAQATANPSDYYYSKVSAPDEYASTATFPISLNDGDAVTGLYPYYNQQLVTKDNSVHSLTGTVAGVVYPNYQLEVIQVTTEHGCSSHRSLVEADKHIYMWWRGEIHRYNGTGTEKVSKRVDPTLASVEMSRLVQIVGARRRVLNQLWWFYPPSGGTQNSSAIIYDYTEDAFIPLVGQTMALAETVFESGIEYLLTAEYDGDIRRQDSGTDFSGTAITSFITFPWISAQRPDEIKIWEELYVPYQTNTGNLIAEYRVASHPREFDAASFTTAGTIDQSVSGELGRAFIGERSRWIQVRLRTVGAAWTQYIPVLLTAIPTGNMF